MNNGVQRGRKKKRKKTDLRDEGDGARRAQVCLDHADPIVLDEELGVEGARDVERGGDLAAVFDDLRLHLRGDVLRREEERRVAAVRAALLHVLRDRVRFQLALLCHAVDINFHRSVEELGDDDWVIVRHADRVRKVRLELVGAVRDVHSGAGEDVRGADEARVADLEGKSEGWRDGGRASEGEGGGRERAAKGVSTTATGKEERRVAANVRTSERAHLVAERKRVVQTGERAPFGLLHA
jgi:hypothetical protein